MKRKVEMDCIYIPISLDDFFSHQAEVQYEVEINFKNSVNLEASPEITVPEQVIKAYELKKNEEPTILDLDEDVMFDGFDEYVEYADQEQPVVKKMVISTKSVFDYDDNYHKRNKSRKKCSKDEFKAMVFAYQDARASHAI